MPRPLTPPQPIPNGSRPSPGLGPKRQHSTVVGGRYRKGRRIGKGAFGEVFQGMDNETGEVVAIKEMSSDAAEELRMEFTLVQGLSHPNVVDIKGFEVQGKKARLYLEWLANGSLSDVQQKFGQIPEQRLKNYTKQMLLGLQFLHSKNILHRDIKPKNILVDHRGILKLTDFGLSRHLNSINPTTRPCGTPVYMAPETIKGQFGVGSDLWAIGATICELATGQLPWSHLDPTQIDNNYALMFHIGNLAGQRGHHPLIPSHLSQEGKDFLLTCFAPHPADRGTCDSLLQHPWIEGVAGSPIRDSCAGLTVPNNTVETQGTGTSSTNYTGTTFESEMEGSQRNEEEESEFSSPSPPLRQNTSQPDLVDDEDNDGQGSSEAGSEDDRPANGR